jgi:hypothetical protein
MKVQLVTPYRVSLLQSYGVTVRDNVTSVYPPLGTPQRVIVREGSCFNCTCLYPIRVTENLARLTEPKIKLARSYKLIRKLLISSFHRALLQSVTFISRLMHSFIQNVDVKIYVA